MNFESAFAVFEFNARIHFGVMDSEDPEGYSEIERSCICSRTLVARVVTRNKAFGKLFCTMGLLVQLAGCRSPFPLNIPL